MLSVFKDLIKDNITIFEAIQKLELNSTNKEDNNGTVYTPLFISDYIVNQLNYTLNKTILEPSIGHGIFLFSLLNHLENKYKLSNTELKEWFENYFFGFDIDSLKIKELKLLIKIYFKKKCIHFINLDNIKVSDTLFYNFNQYFDYCYGNPPYIRTKHLNSDYLNSLRSKYNSCKTGNIDLFYAFVDFSNKIANETIFIIPNSYIYNNSAKNLRNLIFDNLYSIIDFKDTKIFKNVSTYTSILHLKKEQHNNVYYKNNINDKFKTINKEKLNNEHWIFEDINHSELKIKDISFVKSGIETLKNDLYILNDTREYIINNIIYYKKIYNGQEFLIEKELTLPYFKLSKNKLEQRIIYPYNYKTEIIKEDTLKNIAPQLYIYLNNFKHILNARDKGKTHNYPEWYAYGRKQGLSINNKSYYLFVSKMINENVNINIHHSKEHFLFGSGYIIEVDSLNLAKKIQNELNNNLFNYSKIIGKNWSNNYYSFSSKQLKEFSLNINIDI